MPAKPVLSDNDKLELRQKLKDLCEQGWITNGYKKTNIKEICQAAKIAIGTFYVIYPAKEYLFFETVVDIQKKLASEFLEVCQNNPSKDGFAKAIKEMLRKYDEKPFLYDISKPDYQSFITKLSPDAIEHIKFDSIVFFRKAIQTANLRLKTNENLAYAALSALLSTIYAKDALSLTHDYLATVDFMIDILIPNIVE
ncbi:MAG: TetR/AcrR family transcriptional regulator [Defluviitaleaceae bacterium]|nr:TetR/AcrR family transcriptional regulator [Defluviitaleaceae bacterium]